jgi:DNA repair exonuclease SbcCD ATPase subunit
VELSTVTEAVRTLRARNERVSIRAVYALTGGSFRDLSKLMKDATEFMSADEVDELDAEVVEPMATPSLGRIVDTFRDMQAAEREAGVASAALQARRDQLHDLLTHRPPHALTAEDVAASVEARLEHESTVLKLQDEIAQLDRITEAHMAKARAHRAEWQQLHRRADELRKAILPTEQRNLADAQHHLGQCQRDLAHAVHLAEQRVARTQQSLVGYERELHDLQGEPVR